jgi:hypothetical protein
MFESGVCQLRIVCVKLHVARVFHVLYVNACITVAYLPPVSEKLNCVHRLPCAQYQTWMLTTLSRSSRCLASEFFRTQSCGWLHLLTAPKLFCRNPDICIWHSLEHVPHMIAISRRQTGSQFRNYTASGSRLLCTVIPSVNFLHNLFVIWFQWGLFQRWHNRTWHSGEIIRLIMSIFGIPDTQMVMVQYGEIWSK